MSISTIIVLLWTCGQAQSEFEIRTRSDKPQITAIRGLSTDGTININSDITISGTDWYSIRRSSAILPDWPRGPHLEFINGDRICGTIVDSDGDALRWRLAIAGPEQIVRFPLSSIRAIWLTRRPNDEPRWLMSARKRDVIQSRNGDLTLGALTAIDADLKLIRYQAEGKEQQLPLSRIAAIGFNTDLARVRRPKGPYDRLTFADGTRLSVMSITFDGKSWAAQTLFRNKIQLPASNLISVDKEQGKVVPLANLKPTAYRYQSFDGEQFVWTPNRCVSGDALRLQLPAGESTYDRGVGLHADCTITYALSGMFKRFETLAGLDARSGRRGNATIAVFVDGKEIELPGKGRLALATGPIAIHADLTGAKELKIVIGRGSGGNVQDHVNLVEARLIP